MDAVPSKVAMGEHAHLKILLCKSNAFFAFTAGTECSETGEIKLSVPTDSGADIIDFLLYSVMYMIICD